MASPPLPRPSGHGGQTRGLTPASQGMGVGRFGRMFGDPSLDRPTLDDQVLVDLADVMTKSGVITNGVEEVDDGKPIRDFNKGQPDEVLASDAGDENPTVPAGYTYFGQFVDHDITFDPTSLSGVRMDPSAMTDFRTPALDLDSVYGAGPDSQPYLYDGSSGVAKLRTGDDISLPGAVGSFTKHDHLRLGSDADGARAAVIGDKRNDENKIVAQMHTSFVALHNRLIDDTQHLARMCGTNLSDPGDRFKTAVRAVRWHYQWVVLFDYVRDRICEPGVLDEVLNAGGVPRLGAYASCNPDYGYMPVEFAVAAYRMGHSMVRPTYALNAEVGSTAPFVEKRIPIFKQFATTTEALNGFGQAIAPHWGIDWSFFLHELHKAAAVSGEAPLSIPQPSYRIDASLVDPLRSLPEFQGLPPAQKEKANLAYRNLKRSQMDGLPSGEAVAKQLGVTPLTPDELWGAGSLEFRGPKLDADRKALDAARAAFRATHGSIVGRTPLWYYILREAELFGTARHAGDPFGGQHLGPVGSRIVAETFVGLLWYDDSSFLHSQTGFSPVLPRGPDGEFRLSDLIRYALG